MKLSCKLSWLCRCSFVYGQWQRYIEPGLVVTVQSHGCRPHVYWLAYFYILPFDWVLLSFTIFCGDESNKIYNCLCYYLTITCCYRNNGNMYSEYLCISQRHPFLDSTRAQEEWWSSWWHLWWRAIQNTPTIFEEWTSSTNFVLQWWCWNLQPSWFQVWSAQNV